MNPSGFYVDPKLTRSFCAKNKNPLQNIFVEALCDRDRIQTCNRLIRSQLLYSVELRDPLFLFNGCKDTDFFESSKRLLLFFPEILFKETIIEELPTQR